MMSGLSSKAFFIGYSLKANYQAWPMEGMSEYSLLPSKLGFQLYVFPQADDVNWQILHKLPEKQV